MQRSGQRGGKRPKETAHRSQGGAGKQLKRDTKKTWKTTDEEPAPSTETLAKVAAIRESSMQYLEQLSDSDDEEEEEEGRPGQVQLLEKTLSMYYSNFESDVNEIGEQDLLSGVVLVATTSCLICLSSIKRIDAVWSCGQCYRVFHLQCIQRWAVDGVRRQSILSPDLFPDQQQYWSCPNCRHDYTRSQCPTKYQCFCGKVENPTVDAWLLPHSCGEICGRPLEPECGHHCVSLCHPGACPPCPKMISSTCYCGRGPAQMRRCGSRGWGCGRVCRRVLECGQHVCEAVCHEGPCPECQYTLEQSCQCGREVMERKCLDLDWQCGKVCGKLLDCGAHSCEKVCHSGLCGVCPRTGERMCPCGKTSHTLPCTDDVPVCGDTCGKPLPCLVHMCMRPCHYGNCGQCLQMVKKRCRCGKKEKLVSCSSEYLCEARCSIMRQCGRHQCRRKCCDGACPPCEQTCGRQLLCRNHKCSSPCHTGQCYPCTQVVSVTCHCGSTSITVPCGRERRTKPPSCSKLCPAPPSCHHPQRHPHYCHFGHCPPCREQCGKPLPCGHKCLSPCHSEPVTVSLTPVISATVPWAKVSSAPTEQQVVQSCPPCSEPVLRACKGGHEFRTFLCCEVKDYTCERVCGRRLSCGNHYCQRGCHKVINPPNSEEAGEDCLGCELECQKPRPHLCTHSCPLPCHTGKCPSCQLTLRMRCHCATMNKVIVCHEWTSANENERNLLQACNNQCTKILTCGHRCPLQCHVGECSSEESCTRRVTIRCPCKRLKKEVKCNEQDAKRPKCDNECLRIMKEKEEEQRRVEAERQAAEKRERKEAEEALMRQLRGRPKKKKRVVEQEDEEEGWWKYRYRAGLAVLVVSVLIAVCWWTVL